MISLQNITLGYNDIPVLRNIDLHIAKKEFVGIIGLSGAGKSTLLMSIIGNINVFQGRYRVIGYQLEGISKKHLKQLRSQVGFIFQGYNLVNRLSVLHNVMSGMLEKIPLYRALVKYYSIDEITRAYELMQVVGIEHLAMQRSDALSGGQRQRIAIARALAQRPDILLADEPVAALDPKSASQVMEILREVNRTYGVTIVANLHHLDFAKEYCSRIIGIADGKIIFDGLPRELRERDLQRIYSLQATEEPIDNDDIDISHLIRAASITGRENKAAKQHKKAEVA